MRAVVLCAVVLLARDASGQGSEQFTWSGQAARGSMLSVRNIRGDVSIVASDVKTVEVTAMKTWRRGNPAAVRIVANQVGDAIVVCVLWAGARDCNAPIAATQSRDVGDVAVHIAIKVPVGLRLAANTVNGDVSIKGASLVLSAESVNGNVVVHASERTVVASTVNGSVTAYISEPARATLDLYASGRLHSDFAIQVTRALRLGRIQGRIGGGGRRIELRALRGDIWLKRGPG